MVPATLPAGMHISWIRVSFASMRPALTFAELKGRHADERQHTY